MRGHQTRGGTTESSRAELILRGESFAEGQTSLHDLLQAYDAFEGVLDATYSNIAGIERFSESVRRDYRIVVRGTAESSWETFFDILIASTPLIFGGPLTPENLLSTAKATFEFMKYTFDLKKNGTRYEISNDANGTVNVLPESGTQVVFHAPVSINLVSNAKDVLPELRKLLELVNKGVLDQAEIKGQDHNQILQVGKDEAGLFEVSEAPSDDEYEFESEIYRYNKRSRTGRLQVKPLQGLPEGIYTFRVNKPEIQDDVILSMIRRTTTIVARPVVIADPISNQEIIQYLEILDV